MKPDTPDTSGMNKAAESNAEIAGRAQDLAEQQYADQKALVSEYAPLFKAQIQQQLDAQGKSNMRSDDAWADYNAVWRPVEQKLAKDSLEWASPGRQEQEAQRAASGVAASFDQARQSTTQDLQRAGVDSSTIATLSAAGRLEEAKAKAGAADGARRTVEREGMAYLDNAARFGRNMTSTGIATAQLGSQQGAQAQGSVQGLQSLTATPAQTAAGLYQTAVGANNSAANLYGGAANLKMDGQIAQMNSILGGAAAGADIAGMFWSSEKTKKMGRKVSGKEASEAVEKSPSKRWAYKPGLGDGNTKQRMGPTAESLRDATGGVVSDGERVDGIAMLGLHHAAIGDQSRRLRKIEAKVGLSDARKD